MGTIQQNAPAIKGGRQRTRCATCDGQGFLVGDCGAETCGDCDGEGFYFEAADDAEMCDYCWGAEAAHANGLCDDCNDSAQVRALYRTAKTRPPGWDDHLKRLAALAAARLPLFAGA